MVSLELAVAYLLEAVRYEKGDVKLNQIEGMTFGPAETQDLLTRCRENLADCFREYQKVRGQPQMTD